MVARKKSRTSNRLKHWGNRRERGREEILKTLLEVLETRVCFWWQRHVHALTKLSDYGNGQQRIEGS